MERHGGDLVGETLAAFGVKHLYTLCGGHISPILAGAKKCGIGVVDVRGEATAVFAADATSRLTGLPGVAVVTAGPGVTNTVTAVKNAQMAQSPLVVLGGSAPSVLKGRGALQDIDQLSLLKPAVKLAVAVGRNCDIVPVLTRAFAAASSGVPGPVFVEFPVDLLYPESLVREWYGAKTKKTDKERLADKLIRYYLTRSVDRLFECRFERLKPGRYTVSVPEAAPGAIRRASRWLEQAKRPVMIVGSQALLEPARAPALVRAVEKLNVPVYLTGMARGLMGSGHLLHMRHGRKQALRQADLVILAGMPCDFRLDYGRAIGRGARMISINRSRKDLKRNRRPDLGILADPGRVLTALAERVADAPDRARWHADLLGLQEEKNAAIEVVAAERTDSVNPLDLLIKLDAMIADDSLIVADGGDFAATASYLLRPRGPLCWIDAGPFGTLGAGAGFALAARLCRPEAEIWLIYGDGAVGYSLVEMDTFVRHGLSVIAVVGNDAGWTQIARDQVRILDDDVGTRLRRTDYHRAAESLGARGLLLDRPDRIEKVLAEAKEAARPGRPVLINAKIGRSTFREGSISI
ncbi:MAG: thiamine pyrophosphate-binding protein [Desulfobacterales bacterium]